MVGRTPTRQDARKGHMAMLAFAAVVAGSFSFGGRIANDIDPYALTALRFLLAAVVVAALAASMGAYRREDVRAPWRYLILGGLFGTYFCLMFEGLKTATPVAIAAVFTLTPLMSALFGWWVMSQRTTVIIAGALVVGSIGALWVIFRGDLDALRALEIGRGEAIFFVGCAAHALYTPLVPRLNRGEATLAMSSFTMAAGAVVVGLVSVDRILATDWGELPARVWWVLAYLTLFASATSVNLIQYASLRLKAAKVMAYTYLIPAFVAVWEFVLTGVAVPVILVPGLLLTCLALFVLVREDSA